MHQGKDNMPFFTRPFIAADVGSTAAERNAERDPYQVLEELMCVVEALCPTWPPREISSGSEKYLL